MILRVVVAARELDAGSVAFGPLETLVEGVLNATLGAPVRHDNAVQVAELPVPGRGARCCLERELDAERDVEGGHDHTGLVWTESAGNRVAGRVDQRHELLNEVEIPTLSGHVRTGRMPDLHQAHQRRAHASQHDSFLVGPGTFYIHRTARVKARSVNDGHAHVVWSNRGCKLGFHADVGAGHRVTRVAEIQREPIDSPVEVLVAGDVDNRARGRLRTAYHGRVVQQPDLVDVRPAADAAFECERVPRDGRILGGVDAHRTIERVVVLDIERQGEAGEIRARQVPQAQVVVVIVRVVQAEDREVFCRLEDAGDGHTCRGRIVERRRGGATGEALRLEVPARVEDRKSFCGHVQV